MTRNYLTMRKRISTVLMKIVITVFALTGCISKKKISPEEAIQIAKEAYIYGFPMVVNYKTMYNYAVNEKSPEYKGGFNNLDCVARVFTPNDKAFVSPNSDTPYCMLWADLRSEPIIISIPEMESDRFYNVQLIDIYTHNFSYISTVSKGNVSGKYLIAGPDWKGSNPKGIAEVIRCETPFLITILRTQLLNSMF